ncbi:hypothetical protein NC651_003862 [Populus alba x Populus x berolinensis]|nr:hypothetical protein NC651_003862 [Populus alba x Populus x berolinensis]
MRGANRKGKLEKPCPTFHFCICVDENYGIGVDFVW